MTWSRQIADLHLHFEKIFMGDAPVPHKCKCTTISPICTHFVENFPRVRLPDSREARRQLMFKGSGVLMHGALNIWGACAPAHDRKPCWRMVRKGRPLPVAGVQDPGVSAP